MNIKKKYIIKKIPLTNPNHLTLQQSLDDFYNDPKKYFKNTYLTDENHTGCLAFSITPLNSERKELEYTNKTLHHPSQQIKQRNTIHHSIKDDHKHSIQALTDKEVNDMFTSIRLRQNNNKQNEANGQILINNKTNNIMLQYQTNALKLRQHHVSRNQKVMLEIAEKSNKDQSELLMNTSNDHRTKQEAKLYLNKYISKKNYWPELLRQPQIGTYQKVDRKQFFINTGTYDYPKWEIKTLESMIENVVNPSIQEEKTNESSLGYDFLTHNTIDHIDLTKIINKSENLKSLCIEGKSVLKNEFDYFKSLKGKKFIQIPIPKETKEEMEIRRNIIMNKSLNNSLVMTGKMVLNNNTKSSPSY